MSMLTSANASGYYVTPASNKNYLGLYYSRYTVPCEVNITAAHGTTRARGTIKMFQGFGIGAGSYHCSNERYSYSYCDGSKYIYGEGDPNVDPAFTFKC